MEKTTVVRKDTQGDPSLHERILGAALCAFAEKGYAETTTLEIATRAKVSKRDIYNQFGTKLAVLVACIKRRTERMRLSQDLPSPRSREMLASTLTAFAENLVHEVSHPLVIAMFRVAAAEATRSPEIAEALEVSGRETTRRVLADLLARAQKARIIGKGNPSDMAAQFLGLLWEGLQMSLVLGVVAPPKPAKIKRRAAMATAAFLRLHPEPVL